MTHAQRIAMKRTNVRGFAYFRKLEMCMDGIAYEHLSPDRFYEYTQAKPSSLTKELKERENVK